MNNFFSLLLIFALTVTAMSGCSSHIKTFKEESKLKITATLFPQYDFARSVGGDRVEVIQLLPAGAEGHTYEPSAADISTVYSSDLFIYTGEAMEPWAAAILKDKNAPEVLDLSQYIELIASDDKNHGHSEGYSYDPHIWTNPVNAKALVIAVRDKLTELDPDNKDIYSANAAAYTDTLDSFDKRLHEAFDGKDVLLVFGERFAFAYLTKQYGIRAVSPYHGCSDDTEVSAAELENIIKTAKENNISVVYYEEMKDPATARTICEATGAKMLLLHSCHTISTDEKNAGETFLSLMEKNVENLIAGASQTALP